MEKSLKSMCQKILNHMATFRRLSNTLIHMRDARNASKLILKKEKAPSDYTVGNGVKCL